MKSKFSEWLTVILFCGFIAGMLVLYLFLPKSQFSEREKRYLSEFPKVSWAAVSSGQWGEDAETYMADHIPGRDFFVGLNAYYDLLTGRQVGKDIRVLRGRLVEAPVQPDENAVAKNMAAIHNFAAAAGQPVDLMIVPSAGWSTGSSEYQDEALIQSIYSQAGEGIRPVDITSAYAGMPHYYFKTDHHWNSEGAYQAYSRYMTAIGREYRDAADFEKSIYARFQGSTYSRSALWLTPAEELELWTGSQNLTVTNGEHDEVHDGVFYWERLEEADKYTVFLDGNHSVVRIQNPDREGKLLVIRDSYSNSLGCFLAESYGEVVLVDLRYYKQAVSELANLEDFDQILVCYSIGNFMTDVNLVWLR